MVAVVHRAVLAKTVQRALRPSYPRCPHETVGSDDYIVHLAFASCTNVTVANATSQQTVAAPYDVQLCSSAMTHASEIRQIAQLNYCMF